MIRLWMLIVHKLFMILKCEIDFYESDYHKKDKMLSNKN